MNYIIVYRIDEGALSAVTDDFDQICEFHSLDEAEEYCENNRLFQSGQASYFICEFPI